jgi:hypothetical protein
MGALANVPPATEPSLDELRQQISQLQDRIQQLENQQHAAEHAAVTDQTVETILRDADHRSRMMQIDGGFTAGFSDDRFFLASADGNWLFVPHLLLQFRNATNWNHDGDDLENGFEIRRARFSFDGTAFSKDLYYHFQWATRNGTGGVFLQNALVGYDFAGGMSLQGGQYKTPWNKEETVGASRQLAAERSLLNFLIGGAHTDRVQGVSLIRNGERYRAELMYHDGYNTKNTNFQDGTGGDAYIANVGTDFGAAFRFDYYLSNKSKADESFTALGNQEDVLVIGGGADYTQGGDNWVLFHTADIQFENTHGLALYGAYVGAYRSLGTGAAGGGSPPAGDFYDWGLLAQAGYLLTDKLELFARYDYTRLDGGAIPAGATQDVHEITIGANYYFYRQHLKLTLDATWLPNGSPVDAPGLDITAGTENEFVVRGQMQLYL